MQWSQACGRMRTQLENCQAVSSWSNQSGATDRYLTEGLNHELINEFNWRGRYKWWSHDSCQRKWCTEPICAVFLTGAPIMTHDSTTDKVSRMVIVPTPRRLWTGTCSRPKMARMANNQVCWRPRLSAFLVFHSCWSDYKRVDGSASKYEVDFLAGTEKHIARPVYLFELPGSIFNGAYYQFNSDRQ